MCLQMKLNPIKETEKNLEGIQYVIEKIAWYW